MHVLATPQISCALAFWPVRALYIEVSAWAGASPSRLASNDRRSCAGSAAARRRPARSDFHLNSDFEKQNLFRGTCCLRPCWLSLGSWPPHPTSGEPVCGEPAASRIATPPWAAEQQARWPNHSCIDSLCKRGQSPLHICWLARWGPGRPAPLGASRCVESLRRRTSRRRRGQPGGRTRWTSTEGQAERLLTHSASCTVPPRSLTIPAAPHARLVIRLRRRKAGHPPASLAGQAGRAGQAPRASMRATRSALRVPPRSPTIPAAP